MTVLHMITYFPQVSPGINYSSTITEIGQNPPPAHVATPTEYISKAKALKDAARLHLLWIKLQADRSQFSMHELLLLFL